jgi:hypothetical protein
MPAPDQVRQYQDFELSVVAVRETHTYLVTARSTAGQASGESVIDPAADAWRATLDAIAREDTGEAFFLELGARLFDALFPGDVEDAYRAATGYARGEGKGLRLRLRLTQAPEIAALPWEYVHDRQRDIFFAVSSDTPISRFIEPQQVFPPPPPPEGKLRLLAVVSDPQNLDDYGLQHLDAEKELKTLNEALQRLKSQDLLEEIAPLRHAVRADISEALRTHRPHVLHFIGHGAFANERGFLILENEGHQVQEMSDRAFRELLEGQPDTRLVLLNACQGATRAAGDAMVGMGPQLVGRGVPAVVAMQYPVYDRAAISFTREFYRALAHWYPIDVALSQARRAVYLDFGLDRRDWGVPVLFMRDREGILFTAPEKALTHKTSDGDAPVSLPVDPSAVSPVKLREVMIETFDKPALEALCIDLATTYREQNVPDSYNVEYDNLRGESPPSKILYLIDWHRRHHRLDNLIKKVLEDRPFLANELS